MAPLFCQACWGWHEPTALTEMQVMLQPHTVHAIRLNQSPAMSKQEGGEYIPSVNREFVFRDRTFRGERLPGLWVPVFPGGSPCPRLVFGLRLVLGFGSARSAVCFRSRLIPASQVYALRYPGVEMLQALPGPRPLRGCMSFICHQQKVYCSRDQMYAIEPVRRRSQSAWQAQIRFDGVSPEWNLRA